MPAESKTAPRPSKIAGLAIQTVKDIAEFFNALLYGDAGAGKTWLCGSVLEVPSMMPALYIGIEGGEKTLRKKWSEIDTVIIKDEWGTNNVGKPVMRQSAWKKLLAVLTELQATNPYRTYIIDSLTEVQKIAMLQVIRESVAANPDADPEVASFREWGKGHERVRAIVRGFRDLEANVIFTALAANEKDESTGRTMVAPHLQGKLSTEVPGFLDEVFYLYTKTSTDKKDGSISVERSLLTQRTESVVAKDRSDNLPAVLREPTMSKIAEAILGQSKEGEVA